jgi:periplasmic copper chaperone A
MFVKDVLHKQHREISPMRMLRRWLAAALCMAFAGLAMAAESPARVEHARIRWLPGNLPLAGYFDLTNAGRHPFTLTGASSDAFGDVMMHRSIHSGAETEMIPVHDLKMPPGQTIRFAPDGYHLMLMNRTRSLSVGDEVPISLKFSGGRSMEVIFTVKGADMQ